MPHATEKYKLLVLSPNLETNLGHFFSYCKTLQEAAKINGWEFAAAIPENCQINTTPSSWYKILSTSTLKYGPRFIKRIYNKFCYRRSLSKFLASHILPGQKTIIFTEHFSRHRLRALLYSLFFLPKKNTSVWLLYRDYPTNYRLTKDALFFKKCHFFIASILKKSNFRLLTDCDLLQSPLQTFFGRDFSLFPIIEPLSLTHKTSSLHNIPSPPKNKTVCWLAGRSNKEKGSDIIEKIFYHCESHKVPIHFITSKILDVHAQHRFHYIDISFLPEILSTSAYIEQFARTDVFLIPYCKNHYKWKTSGVFVEAIAAGKPVLVTEGTWMAHELQKFDLHKLITSWDAEDIIKKISFIRNNQETKENIRLMQQHYLNEYSATAFAAALQKLATS